MRLTVLQERFAREYLRDADATNAYRRAGGMGTAAKQIAFEMLQLPQVRERIRVLPRGRGAIGTLLLPEAPRGRQPTDLYFVLNAPLGAVKIGVTKNIVARMTELQVSSPVELGLLGLLREGAMYERRLHGMFDDVRIRGEWFQATGSLLRLARRPRRILSLFPQPDR